MTSPRGERDTAAQAVAQLRRLLLAIPRLADDRPHSLADVAAEIGTDVATLTRDLAALARRSDPEEPGFVEGVTVFLGPDTVELRTSFFKRPLGLTVPELMALELGLAVIAAERPPEERGVVARARERVAAARAGATAALDLPVVADLGRPADAAVLDVVRQGAMARRRVRIVYHSAGADAASERTLAPYAVVYAQAMWYAVGHDDRADGLRIFRCDRIHAAELTSTTFDPPERFSLDDLADGRVFIGEAREVVVIRYGPAVARWIAERERGRPEPDGGLVVEYPLADPLWAVRHVLQYGPEAEVLAPPGVRALVRERLARVLASGQGPSGEP